jgi:hypothetical protein
MSNVTDVVKDTWDRAYNQALSDVLSQIDTRNLETKTSTGFTVVYKETLIKTIKKLKK